MKSNYKRIGDLIRLVDERNTNMQVRTLLGLSISKEFIPSVANTVGTDMGNYKIIRRNQFACSTMQVRRDKKMPVALLESFDEAIISAAYPVFEVIDTEIILPEYMMMWFRRSEFDREACFYAIGGVRGSIEWEDFCNMLLPVPAITEQREIVREYNVVVHRINLNMQVVRKLEETARAIYKQWFVDFEFPDENGNPYKSSGGEMEFNEQLDKEIPKGWKLGTFESISTVITGFAFNADNYSLDEGISVLRGENVTEQRIRWDTHKKWNKSFKGLEGYFLKENDVVIGMDGSKVGKNWSLISEYDLPLLLAQRVACVRATIPNCQTFLYYSLLVLSFEDYVSQVQTGTSVPHISGQQILDFPILIPSSSYINLFASMALKLVNHSMILNYQNTRLAELTDILMAKMSSLTEVAL